APRRAIHLEHLVPAPGPSAEFIQERQCAKVVDVEVRDEDLVELVQREARGDVIRDRPLADVENKVLTVPSWTKIEVFIRPGRMNGAVPMKMMRISLGWTSSVRGNQFAALFSHGCGLMPSYRSPSFQRPMGTPAKRAARMSCSELGFSCAEAMVRPVNATSAKASAAARVSVTNPIRSLMVMVASPFRYRWLGGFRKEH